MSVSAGARFDAVAPMLARAAGLVMRSEPVPGGLLVACARDGVAGVLPFGLADMERGIAVTPAHLFEIGSISKFLASVVINQLVDEGRVSLADPVVRYLPWLDAGPYTERITLEHLLQHTAGLVSGVDGLTDEKAQAWALRHRRSAEPGRLFHYSNIGYILVGLVISAVTGRHHGEELRRRVFEPLGVSTAATTVRNADRSRLAVGYVPAVDDQPWLPGDALAPAPWLEALGADGNVALDADGVAVLLRLMLGDGGVGGARVLSAAAMTRIQAMFAPDGEPLPELVMGLPATTSRYGLGLNVETIGGAPCLTHGGGMVGYASFVLADRSHDLAVGVVTNANGDCLAAQLLARHAHRVLLAGAQAGDQDGASDLDLPAARLDPVARAAATDPSMLRGLAGTDDSGTEVLVRIVACPEGDLPPSSWSSGSPAESGAPVSLQDSHSTGAGGAANGLRVVTDHGEGTLYRDLYGRFATDHTALRTAFLHRAAPSSSWSSESPAGSGAPISLQDSHSTSTSGAPTAHTGAVGLVGQYRSHNPWFTNFRIVRRGADLYLTAAGGVEAPSDDELLVPIGAGEFRIGAEPWLPERLTVVAEIDGVATIVDLGDCRYARSSCP